MCASTRVAVCGQASECVRKTRWRRKRRKRRRKKRSRRKRRGRHAKEGKVKSKMAFHPVPARYTTNAFSTPVAHKYDGGGRGHRRNANWRATSFLCPQDVLLSPSVNCCTVSGYVLPRAHAHA